MRAVSAGIPCESRKPKRDEPGRPQGEHPPERRFPADQDQRDERAADPDDRLRAQQQTGEVGGLVRAQFVEQVQDLQHGQRGRGRRRFVLSCRRLYR